MRVGSKSFTTIELVVMFGIFSKLNKYILKPGSGKLSITKTIFETHTSMFCELCVKLTSCDIQKIPAIKT